MTKKEIQNTFHQRAACVNLRNVRHLPDPGNVAENSLWTKHGAAEKSYAMSFRILQSANKFLMWLFFYCYLFFFFFWYFFFFYEVTSPHKKYKNHDVSALALYIGQTWNCTCTYM